MQLRHEVGRRSVGCDEACREAKQTRQLIHEGRIALIKKRAIDFGLGKGYSEAAALVYGERKQLEAYEYILTQLPIWDRIFEREKGLVADRRKEAITERAAAIAERAHWDAERTAANRAEVLQTPGSHMVCRAPVQTVLNMENNMRFDGHNMGKAPVLLGAVMKATKADIVDYATNCDTTPDWWTKRTDYFAFLGLRGWVNLGSYTVSKDEFFRFSI